MSSTRRAVGLMGLVLLVVACAPQRPQAPDLATCTSRFVSLSESAVVLRVGQLETVTFVVQVSWTCDGQRRQSEAITVEAVDDEGRAVGVEVRQTRESSPRADTVALEVTFTTPETSSVAFRLRAEPSLGLIQRSFPAVKPTTPIWDERSTPGTCDGAIEGPDGGPLFCLEANATVRRLDGPAWMQSGVNSAAFTTDTTGVVRLWLFLRTGVAEVWRFDRGLPERAGTQRVALIPTAAHSRGRRVVIAGETPTNSVTLLQFEFAAEALGVALPSTVPVGALRFVSDDEVEVARGERLDVVRLSAGGVTNVPLPVANRQPVAPVSVGADGLWYAIDTAGTSSPVPGGGGGSASGNQDVQVVRPDGGVARVAITNRLGTGETLLQLPPMVLTDVVPIWFMGRTTTGNVVTAVPINAPDGGLALRYLETDEPGAPSWASSRWVFGPPTPGRLLRMRREP